MVFSTVLLTANLIFGNNKVAVAALKCVLRLKDAAEAMEIGKTHFEDESKH